MRTARSRSVYLVLMTCLVVPHVGHSDAINDLEDATARIQYAFHTRDGRSIEDAIASVQRLQLPESRKGLKEYYIAYAYWRLADVHADAVTAGRKGARNEVTRAASACEEAAERAIVLDPRLAEAHAIKAICNALGSRKPDALSFGSCERHRSLRTARELEPANPRVELIEAQCTLNRDPKAFATMLPRLQALVKAFEALPPAGLAKPDWGMPETLLLLAESQLQRGDTVAARDSIERALVLAPDYQKAREMLERAATRAR